MRQVSVVAKATTAGAFGFHVKAKATTAPLLPQFQRRMELRVQRDAAAEERARVAQLVPLAKQPVFLKGVGTLKDYQLEGDEARRRAAAACQSLQPTFRQRTQAGWCWRRLGCQFRLPNLESRPSFPPQTHPLTHPALSTTTSAPPTGVSWALSKLRSGMSAILGDEVGAASPGLQEGRSVQFALRQAAVLRRRTGQLCPARRARRAGFCPTLGTARIRSLLQMGLGKTIQTAVFLQVGRKRRVLQLPWHC